MYFVIHALDKEGRLEQRLVVRETHLAYLRSNTGGAGLQVIHGGPLLADDGEKPIGSMLVIKAESLDQVTSFAARDPYSLAGIFANVQIRPWRWSLGNQDV